LETSRLQLGEDQKRERVIWAIRGLRLLTSGTRFSSKTNYVFTEQELTRYSVLAQNDGSNEFLFFNELMSAPYIYLAPLDVQESIIERWKTFFINLPPDYRFTLATKDEEWYY